MNVFDHSAKCVECGATYRVDDGIIDLRTHRNDYYFNPVPREEMRQLTVSGKTSPWPLTIRRFLESVNHNPDWLDNLVADGRYAWQLFLKFSPDSRVLDLGCGLGNLANNIAGNVAHVYALDLTYERLQFAHLRFDKSGVGERITLLAGGDSEHLPFPDQSLDCVTLSGVLEWVADDDSWGREGSKLQKAVAGVRSFFGASNPRRTQLRFLKEIRRVLKPEGQIFVGIENRLSYRYFGGRPDHHSGLWYASLLPRFAANLYSIVANRRPYRTYTYSYAGYSRLLKEAGFPVQEFIGLNPGYSNLTELIPFQTNGNLWKAPRSSGRHAIKRGRNFVPAYGIIGSQKASDRPTLAEQLAFAISRDFRSAGGSIHFSSFGVTGKHKGIIRGSVGDASIVVKVPFGMAATSGCESNYAFLEESKANGRLSGLLAEPLGRGKVQGMRYFVERRVKGRLLATALTVENAPSFFSAASRLLETLNPRLLPGGPLSPTGELFRLQVSDPLEQVRAAVEGSTLADDLQRYFENHLGGLSACCGIAHGDMSVSNIFVEGPEVSGIVDWDAVDRAGLPILDALGYTDSVRRLLASGESTASNVARLADWKQLDPVEREFLGSWYERSGIPVAKHAAFVSLYWLQHVAQQLHHGLQYDRPAIDQRIEKVFERLIQPA
ncbi:MAG: methyltransferase domain-containing protein [Burkholderiaceae bacterium]|jgi:ubiquinone/menaquinone biosynthesis C-methylase UbiE/aminoglycoside phosphotransferase (APT) family kinase protein|nr:methyltransferase domain-containing protein [Burkholderiaceae bacterium]